MPLISTTTEYVEGIPVVVEEYESASADGFISAVGDVVRFGSGGLRMVVASNPSSCRHVSLIGQTKKITVRKGFEDERTFDATSYGTEETCAQRLPREYLVKRLGEDGFKSYQQARTDGVVADWITTQLGSVEETQTNEEMKTKKPIENPRGGLYADGKRAEAAAGKKSTGKKSGKKAGAAGAPKEAKKKAHNRSRVLRWCGAAGLTVDEAKKLTAHLKLGEITNGWYEVGMEEGRKKSGPLPAFAEGEEAKWTEIAKKKD